MLRGFATGSGAVMTRNTVADKTAVVNNGHGIPVIGAVAKIAFRGGWNMTVRFASGGHAIMATGARSDNFVMIDGVGGHGFPRHRSRRMAGVADIRCIDMVQGPRMAGTAEANDLSMIHPVGGHRLPSRGVFVMATVTSIGRGNMRR